MYLKYFNNINNNSLLFKNSLHKKNCTEYFIEMLIITTTSVINIMHIFIFFIIIMIIIINYIIINKTYNINIVVIDNIFCIKMYFIIIID